MLPVTTAPSTPTGKIVRGEWELLVQTVEAYTPTVVVLIARKPPRMLQRLGLCFRGNPLVISDLALPFARKWIAGARVAIVDDIVNVGSTVERARAQCDRLGAREVEAFAIVRREREAPLADVTYVFDRPLDLAALHDFSERVPDTLQGLAKPYDLDFPILPRRLAAPYGTVDDLLARLIESYDADRVYDLTTSRGARSGVRRLAVEVEAVDGAHSKVRIYADARSGDINVVPIHIPTVLPSSAPSADDTLATQIWSTVTADLDEDEQDARARVRLFLDSLALGRRFLHIHGELLTNRSSELFSLEDAKLIFGPVVARLDPTLLSSSLRFPPASTNLRPPAAPADRQGPDVRPTSRFLVEARKQGFVERVTKRAAGEDRLSAFLALFDELAERVGAADPSRYDFDWPYTREEIRDDPYLRLRIGPTANDLVWIVHSVVPDAGGLSATAWQVTRLLDRFIDSGGVVPTTAQVDGEIVRIYRKGERQPRVEASERLLHAWRRYGKPMSLTRATKLAAIMAFSDPGDSSVGVSALPRGNTLAFRPTVLHDETEVVFYLRGTRQIERAPRQS
jgi:hypothetical protein